MPKIKFVKKHPDAVVPKIATKGAVGFDLVAVEEQWIFTDAVRKIRTGLAMEIPFGWEAQIRPRSGMSIEGVHIANAPATIDSDFRGEICVLARYIRTADEKDELHRVRDRFFVSKGMRIAQMVFVEVPQDVEFEEVEELSSTERGEGGFGSTGR